MLQKSVSTHGGTRTPNLRFRRPTPYPLGHAGTVVQRSCHILMGLTRIPERDKKVVRRPGIEPGSQEWESCMIPLHQRRALCKSPLPSTNTLPVSGAAALQRLSHSHTKYRGRCGCLIGGNEWLQSFLVYFNSSRARFGEEISHNLKISYID